MEKREGIFEKIKKKFIKADEKSPAFRLDMAKRLNGRHIRYVTERKDNDDLVIGREGHVNITGEGDEFAVTCGIKTLFRAKIIDLSMWELLSGDGAVLTGFDLESGFIRTVIIYYTYYR